jgi:hypothetical protein
MQAADLWDGDDLALGRRLDFSRERGVSLQGQMCAGFVIIIAVSLQNPS